MDETQIVIFAPIGSHFVIGLPTRPVEIAGIAPIPDGLGNRLIDGVAEPASGRVVRRERLGRLLNSYFRDAA